MNREDVDWKGYWPSCPTPYSPGGDTVDLDALRSILEYYVDCGFHGVLVNGTVGEWFSQTEDERRAVAETAIEHVARRMTVVIGCTGYTAREVVSYGRHAMSCGADGVEASPPPYSKPFPHEIIQYYTDISDALDAPILAYNWPHGTSVDIGPTLFERIAAVENVVAVKDSTPDPQQFFETAQRVVGQVRVFGPFMTTRGIVALRSDGGDGFIGGGSLFGPTDASFWENLWLGEFSACEEHVRRSESLFPRLWLPGGWAGVHGAYQSELKAAMAMLGQPGGDVRPPRLPITDEHAISEIRSALVDAALLDR